jgi:hypothetical protein
VAAGVVGGDFGGDFGGDPWLKKPTFRRGKNAEGMKKQNTETKYRNKTAFKSSRARILDRC